MKKAFMFYPSFMETIETIPQIKYRYLLLESIIKLGTFIPKSDEELTTFIQVLEQKLSKNPQVLGMFFSIKPQILANLKKFLNGCKGAEYGALGAEFGKLGGRPKKPPKNPPNEEGIMNNEEGIMNNEEGIMNNDYSFKKENKEKSFQNSDCEENETNEINETKQPLKFADLPENLRVCGIYDNNTLLEANKEENNGVFKPPKAKAIDPYFNPELDCYFRVYEELCPNLARLRFERRNAQIRELLARFIDEIDDDVGYFKSLCAKANNLKRICEKPIDFKMLINNHIGIFNGKYENDSFDVMDLFKKKQE